MKVIVNGAVREIPEGASVGALLELLGSPRAGFAVARNESVVRRDDYDRHELADGDRVEIIKAVAGG